MDLKDAGDRKKAADTFLLVYQDYPGSPMAKDSLLQAIQYYREAAQADRSQVDTLEELLKRFIIDFPQAKSAAPFQFELGLIYYQKSFFQEALARFRFFLDKFPHSPLRGRARYLVAKTYLQLGRIDQARQLFDAYSHSKNKQLRAKGLAGLGEIYNRQGHYEKALATLKKSMSLSSTFYLNYPEAEVLRDLGLAYFKVGNEVLGRKNYFHYLNLVGNSSDRLSILLGIAESFHRQGMAAAAQGIYKQIVEKGNDTEKPYLIARFRVAQYLDDPDSALPEWQHHGDLKDPAGDQPYTALLAVVDQGPLAEDARRGLFRRYEARDSFTDALNIARIYLRRLPDGEKNPKSIKAANDMLLYVMEHLVKAGDYKGAYAFYKAQYRHVIHYPTGRLLYLVGQSLQSLYLYHQAATVYWKALGLPLTDKEKIDLYYRRAEVYLAMPDLPAANRLLSYLRDKYKGTKAVGEIYFLSGRLAEREKDLKAARQYYRQAFEIDTLAKRTQQYAADYLRLLLETGQLSEMQNVLAKIAGQQGGLSKKLQQQWLVRLGTALKKEGEMGAAWQSYQGALAADMPQKSNQAQKAWLELGDMASKEGKTAEAKKKYEKAAAGPDALLKSLAGERLKQIAIDNSLSTLNLPAGK